LQDVKLNGNTAEELFFIGIDVQNRSVATISGCRIENSDQLDYGLIVENFSTANVTDTIFKANIGVSRRRVHITSAFIVLLTLQLCHSQTAPEPSALVFVVGSSSVVVESTQFLDNTDFYYVLFGGEGTSTVEIDNICIIDGDSTFTIFIDQGSNIDFDPQANFIENHLSEECPEDCEQDSCGRLFEEETGSGCLSGLGACNGLCTVVASSDTCVGTPTNTPAPTAVPTTTTTTAPPLSVVPTTAPMPATSLAPTTGNPTDTSAPTSAPTIIDTTLAPTTGNPTDTSAPTSAPTMIDTTASPLSTDPTTEPTPAPSPELSIQPSLPPSGSGPCEFDTSLEGYSSIEDINLYMENELARIIAGGTPEAAYDIVLCPEAPFDTSSSPLVVQLNNATFRCVEDFACTIRGSGTDGQVLIEEESFPESYPLTSVTFRDLWFSEFTGTSISAVTDGEGVTASATFIACQWFVSTCYCCWRFGYKIASDTPSYRTGWQTLRLTTKA
jgi:hypothetical protein